MTRGPGGGQAASGSDAVVGPEAAGAWVAGDGTPVAASGRRPAWILPARPVRWTRRGRRLLSAVRRVFFWLLVLAAAYVIGTLGAACWLLYA